MARKGATLSGLVQQIVREAPEPLALDAIAERLEALAPGGSKNFKNAARNALNNAAHGGAIAIGDGRFGWKPRLVTGAVQRHIFYDEDLAERELLVGDALRDMLAPAHSTFADKADTLRLELEGADTIVARLDAHHGQWRLDAGARFWDWLERAGARPGDSLIVSALDAEARRYGVRLEPAAARDDAAITERNRLAIERALAFLRRHKGRAPIWETVAHLNVSGVYHHPVPPDPFEDLWTTEVYGPVVEQYGGNPALVASFERLLRDMLDDDEPLDLGPIKVEVGPEDLPPGTDMETLKQRIHAIYTPQGIVPIADDDPLLPAVAQVAARSGLPSPTGRPYLASQLQQLFGDDPEILDWIEDGAALGMVEIDPLYDPEAGGDWPEGLPEAYRPTGGPRRPQPSPAGKQGPVETYTLRLTYRDRPSFSRDIEIAADQNFEDLHLAIQQALGWSDDHMYSFFLGRRPYDPENEIGSPGSDAERLTYEVSLGSVGLKPRKKFLYLFDFGDEHLFTLEVLGVNPQAPKGAYPKVVARKGRAPSQY